MSVDVETAQEVLRGYDGWVRQQSATTVSGPTIQTYLVWYADQKRLSEHSDIYTIAANPELHHSEIGLEIRKILGLQDVDVQGEERL
jgi:hypothetical protein